MEKKTPEQVIAELRNVKYGEPPFFPFHKPDDMDNETYQQEILRAQEEQAAYFTRYEEAQVEILNDYVKQETERLQAENKAMRELLKEIELEMKFTQGYNPLIGQIQTLLNPK